MRPAGRAVRRGAHRCLTSSAPCGLTRRQPSRPCCDTMPACCARRPRSARRSRRRPSIARARREHLGAGPSNRVAEAMAGTPASLSWRWQGRGRHHRRRQGQAHRQDRHRRDAVAVAPGRGQRAGRELRTDHRGRMPSRRRRIVRRHPQADQGEVRARPDRHADSPRWPAADHLHAVRADPPHGGQAGRRTARPGGGAAITVFPHRPADRRRAFKTCSGTLPAI